MNAQEMFKELGYELTESKWNTREYTKIKDKDLIVFWNKKIEYYNIYDGYTVEIVLYKAIHQQMVELGWLDEKC
jgi:hypothetical protein